MKSYWFSSSVLTLSILLVAFAPKKDATANVLTVEDKQNSVFFKTMRNANRIAVFEKLQPKIKIKTGEALPGQFSTYSDVVNLLGEPNINIKYNTLVYTLNPSNGCKAYIGLDAWRNVTYCVTKDCN